MSDTRIPELQLGDSGSQSPPIPPQLVVADNDDNVFSERPSHASVVGIIFLLGILGMGIGYVLLNW